ncbi:hypothetical protein [Chryseobacterium sp. 22532]|uniref:hypothetical protein n=1 Tax=Chryseobacterium sp. 22532 TaxID=3453938 RepID=UPI003F82E672
MYNYRPIGIYSAKTMADEEREDRKERDFFEDSVDDQQQKKKNVNLIIALEADGKAQFDDTYNTIWEVRHIPSFANYESFVDLAKRFHFKNIIIVHHGNAFSDHTYPDSTRVVLNANFLSILTKSYDNFPKKDLISIDNQFFEDLRKETEKYFNGGLLLKEVKSYISLRLLFSQMLDNANFFSVACDEADDRDFLTELAKLTDKKMKIFANSNFTRIETSRYFPPTNPFVRDFGSILNEYLTLPSSWLSDDGWYYFDTASKKQIVTKKDLWLYSMHKSKIYDLFERKKNFTPSQIQKINDNQLYHSKKFEKAYIQHEGKAQYDLLITQIIKRNPELTPKKK